MSPSTGVDADTQVSEFDRLVGLEISADDPEYLRFIDMIQKRLDAELARVREMEENGRLARTPDDLPYIEFELAV